jgi:hypothetical protein
MNRFAYLITTALLTTISMPHPALAQDQSMVTAAEAETDPEIAAINARYAEQFAGIEAEGRKLKDDAPDPSAVEAGIGVEFDVKWEITTLKFDVPEIVMKTREFSMHLPQFRMKTTTISWDNPEFYNEYKKVGEYPCFYDWEWHSCDIKMDVPVLKMVRREASFDVPEVFWDVTSFSLDIPEFYSKRIEIKLHLPQFYVKDVKVEIGEHKERVEALSAKAKTIAEAQKSEVMAVVASRVANHRKAVEDQFAQGIASLDAAINQISAAGADPTKVPGEGGTINLIAMKDDLIAKRDATLADMDAQIAQRMG